MQYKQSESNDSSLFDRISSVPLQENIDIFLPISRSSSQKLDEVLINTNLASKSSSKISTATTRSSLPFKVHLTQSVPDEHIRELFFIPQDLNGSSDQGCEVRSNSTADEHSEDESKKKMTIVQVAINMINNNRLSLLGYAQELSGLDKSYLSNILFLKNKSIIGTELATEKFVERVNSSLGEQKEKRNDDKLRFIYKRAIKYLLEQCSDYEPNKLHRMQNYEQQFTKKYYKDAQDELCKDLMDTTFASKKKLQRLFMLSESFKRDFMDFTRNQIEKYYSQYTLETYSQMFREVWAKYDGEHALSYDFLIQSYKRLPWRASDVAMTVQQIQKIAH